MRKCEMQRVKGVNWKDRATSSLGLLRMKVNFKRVSHRRYRFPDRWRCSSLWKSWKEIPSPLPYPSVFNCKAIPGFISCEKLVSWLSILSFPPFFYFYAPSIFDPSNPIFFNENWRILEALIKKMDGIICNDFSVSRDRYCINGYILLYTGYLTVEF